MIKTKEDFEKLVADLSELEMSDLLDVCTAVVERNKWSGLQYEYLKDFDRLDELENEVHEKDEKIDMLEQDAQDNESITTRALELLIDGKIDEAKKKLAQI